MINLVDIQKMRKLLPKTRGALPIGLQSSPNFNDCPNEEAPPGDIGRNLEDDTVGNPPFRPPNSQRSEQE